MARPRVRDNITHAAVTESTYRKAKIDREPPVATTTAVMSAGVEQADEPREAARLGRRAEQQHRARRRERDDQRGGENLALARHEAGRHERRERQEDQRDPEPRPGKSLERPADGERFHYVTSLW
jgi:hypothetical protein